MKHSLKQKQNTTRSKSAGFIHINFRTQVPKTFRQSISRQNNHTDLFSGMYNGKNISQQNESKLIIYKGTPTPIDQIIKLKTKTQQRTTKTVEQLLEQNIQLKNQINKLKQQMSIIKAQMSVNYKRKSDHDLGKEMEIQFYKDVYWTNNEKSFRIVGMRQQYQKLKKEYNKQAKQLEQVKVKLIKNGITQAQVYIGELQLQNKKYKSLLQQQNGKKSKNISRTPFKGSRSNKEQEMKNKSLQQELLIIKQKLKEKDSKITFLEKVIINKDNRDHSMSKRARKIQKQNDILANSHNNLLDQLELMKKREEIQNIKYKSFYSQQINKLKREFKKQLNEKDRRIKELQESHKKLQSGYKNNLMNQSGGISISVLNSKANRKLSLDYGNKDLTPLQQENEGTPAKRYVSDQKQQVQHKLQQNISQIQVKMESREPKRADKKHSDKSIKMRRVQFSQVQHLGELLRYRMIGFRVAPSQIKDEFIRKKVFTQQSNRQSSQNSISIIAKQVQTNSELEWQDQYISMGQIINIVRKQPFNLDTKQSVLLARYLIEDSDTDYVYYDQINENKRQIVKSIIKSLIGPYQLTSQADISSYTEVMSRFSTNLRTTLSTYYPEGILAKQKLLQIVKGIGVQLNAKQRQLLIGKASIKSQNLNQLKYVAIFE